MVWLNLFNSSSLQILFLLFSSHSHPVSSPTLLHPTPVIFAFFILTLLSCTALFFLCCLFFSPSFSFPVHCSSFNFVACFTLSLTCLSPSFIAHIPPFVSCLSFSFCGTLCNMLNPKSIFAVRLLLLI